MKLRFGDLTFDGGTRQLWRGTTEVHLSPKAFDLLQVLIGHRPRAVSKHDIHLHLWPSTHVSEANLASLIAEVRDALGDDAREPRFVRTAHRFGYAFCAEATPSADGAMPEAPSFCWLLKDGRRVPLCPGDNILGRDDGGIRLDSETVSRRHARISVSGSDVVLEDLGSKNGTFVGGERVAAPVRLRDGDEIRTGAVVMRFRMTTPKGATATWSGGGG